jgi:hypothetical protein
VGDIRELLVYHFQIAIISADMSLSSIDLLIGNFYSILLTAPKYPQELVLDSV